MKQVSANGVLRYEPGRNKMQIPEGYEVTASGRLRYEGSFLCNIEDLTSIAWLLKHTGHILSIASQWLEGKRP